MAEETPPMNGAAGQDPAGDAERSRYRDLFHEAPVAYLITDAAGLIVEINAAAGDLLQISPVEAAGKSLAPFFREPSDLRDRLGRLARLEPVDEWSAEITPSGADPVQVMVSANAVTSPDGSTEVRWLLRDSSHDRDLQDRERALHREHVARLATLRVAERARYLAEVSGRLMGVLDTGEVWRTAAAALSPVAVAAVLIQLGDDAVDGGEPARVRAVTGSLGEGRDLDPLVDRALDPETEQTLGVTLSEIATAIHHGEADVLPGTDATGACLLIPLRTGDTTHGAIIIWLRPDANVGEELLVNRHLADRIALALETARLFQELVRTRRQAEEAGAAEADFLAMVSHELRTPLTAITSYAELLEARVEEMPEQLRRYARQIGAAAQHQRELVEQVLSFKRIQRVGHGGDPEDLDYRDVVQFVVGLVRPQVEGRHVELLTDLPDTPVRGRCDPGMLRQVLANLLANAIRHTETGHVKLSLVRRDPWVEIRIEDTGVGIQAADLPRIFDRFWRGRTDGHERAGSGLGLTIVRELVNHMHGEIDVESEPGVGTTFTVRIPREA